MALNDLITTSVALSSSQLAQANFGKPMILANGDNTTSWGAQVYREYSSLPGVGNDFATTTATYKQANAIFSQNPTVPLLGIGLRASSIVHQVFYMDLTASALTALAALNTITFGVDGNAFSYTGVSGDATHDTAITDLVAALVAASWYGASGLTITADTTQGAGKHQVKFVGAVSVLHDITVTGSMLNYLVLFQTCLDAGASSQATIVTNIGTDLTNIAQQNNTWYTLLSPFSSPSEINALAAYAVANGKALAYQTSDTVNVTLSAATDATNASAGVSSVQTVPPVTATAASIMAYQKSLGATLDSVMGIYTHTLLNFSDAAWAASKLWTNPGSETWAYATLSGVAVTQLTETQRNNVVGTLGNPAAGKYGNVYESVGGANITEIGITRGGQFFDTPRFLAWVNANIQIAILAAFVAVSSSGQKIPYTQQGIAFVCGLVLGVLKQGIANGGFSNAPLPSVPVPALSGISQANLVARNLPNIGWSATLAGAIQSAQVQGTVTVF